MNRKIFEDETKLQNERNKFKRKCSCGHSVIVLPIGKREYVICGWCHKKVFRDIEKQKLQDQKVEREAFRVKMWGLLKTGG
jgi:hypothetical protein